MAFKKLTLGLCVAFSVLGAYVVEEGDTLWDISADKLSDPFAWPTIWEANPQIKNPHLIYPGDQVNLKGSANSGKTQKSSPQTQVAENVQDIQGVNYVGDLSEKNLKTSFYDKLKGLDLADSTEYLSLQKNELKLDSVKKYQTLNVQMQVLSPQLVLPLNENRTFPNEVPVFTDNKAPTLLIAQKSKVIVNLGIKDNIKLGDTLDFFSTPNEYVTIGNELNQKNYHKYQYAGYGIVQENSDKSSRVLVEEINVQLKLKDARAKKRISTPIVEVLGYEPVEKTSVSDMSRIVKRYTPSQFAANFSYVSVNKGVQDNYQVGDAVAFWNRDKNPNYDIPPRLIGQGIITWTGPTTSTVMILGQIDYNRNPSDGDYVSLTHKAIFKINQ